MTKHTESGWDWEYDKRNSDYIINAPLRIVAKIYATRDEVTDIANANLIAAAPDLLDACEDLIDLVEVLIRYPYPEAVAKEVHVVKETETFEAVVKAKEAINKAK